MRELIGADTIITALVEPLLAIVATMLREFGLLTKHVLNIARKEQVRSKVEEQPGRGPVCPQIFNKAFSPL
ncbi:hypothetical protein MPL3356_340056 [Mesorhizobium plurifarium]|uniref:Uncharacterized protein n=1 Tax=Mesorhizobium plurifarium TaxID=69974 RepID=A0A090DV34_MESPL|nr:hypothetical protein MPL3356_340056 [Mesorhizobium plurifarium]